MFLLDSFSSIQLTTIASAYFIAALVKGVTGLGFSSTCLPILTLAFGLKEALPMVLIPSVASNLVVMVSTGGFLASAQRFWPMVLSACVSVFAGLWALTRVGGISAAAVLGLVLLIYVAFALTNTRFRLTEARTRKLEPAIGAATGFINGLTGSQVMPLIPYLLSLDRERLSVRLARVVAREAALVRVGRRECAAHLQLGELPAERRVGPLALHRRGADHSPVQQRRVVEE